MMVSHRSQGIEMLSRNEDVRGIGVRRKAMDGKASESEVFSCRTPHVSRLTSYARRSVDLGKIALLRCHNFQPGLGLGSD